MRLGFRFGAGGDAGGFEQRLKCRDILGEL